MGVLTAEFEALQTVTAQVMPEQAFGIRLPATQGAGVCDEGHGSPFPLYFGVAFALTPALSRRERGRYGMG